MTRLSSEQAESPITVTCNVFRLTDEGNDHRFIGLRENANQDADMNEQKIITTRLSC